MELKTWLTNASGEDIRVIHDDFDFQIGGDSGSQFEITCKSATYTEFEEGGRVYVPDTEYGGLIGETYSVTRQDIIYVRGLTWRGMMEKKVVQPPSGSANMILSGDILELTRQLVDGRFDGLVVGALGVEGVTVSNHTVKRYCTLLEALESMYASVGYRVDIRYIQTDDGGHVQVRPTLQTDYSDEVELSKEGKLQFTCRDVRNGVNHLICLGQGEGTDRTVIHLYANNSGTISKTKSLAGVKEIEEVYENTSADATQLEEDGTKRLKELTNRVEFDATASDGMEQDIAVGDIVSGADSFTGRQLKKAIYKKIVRRENGVIAIDYEVEQED